MFEQDAINEIVDEYRTASTNAGTPVTDEEANTFKHRLLYLLNEVNQKNLLYKPVATLPYHRLLDLVEGNSVRLDSEDTDFPGVQLYALDPFEVVAIVMEGLNDFCQSRGGQLDADELGAYAIATLRELDGDAYDEMMAQARQDADNADTTH